MSPETRAKISAKMKGKRNAAAKPCVCEGKGCDTCGGRGVIGHKMSEEGSAAIAETQRQRWAEYNRRKEARSA